MKDKLQLDKLLIEATVIVGSILLAFSIDAWWGVRGDREGERIIFEALLQDIEQKKTHLARNRSYNDAIYSAVSNLLLLDQSQPLNISSKELDKLIDTTLYTNEESYWESAPLNSLFQGGDLSSIANQKLIQNLASIQLYFDRLKTFSRKDRDFTAGHLAPYLRERTNFEQMVSSSYAFPGISDVFEFPELNSIIELDHSEILLDMQFRNLLIDKIYSVSDIRNIGYAGFEERLDELITMLEKELDY